MGKVIPSIVKMSDRVNEIDGRVEKLEKEQKVMVDIPSWKLNKRPMIRN